MSFRSVVRTIVAALLVAAPALQAQETFIEYSVTGSASATGRDADAVLCSVSEDGLNVHSIGTWIFTFEAPSADPGEHDATLRVAAPDDVKGLHDDNFRTDDRLYGDATIVIEPAGTGQMNVPLIRVRFTAKGLKSDTGAAIDVTGELVCPKL